MRVGANELTEIKEKAQAFLETFFPKMDEPHEGQSTQTPLGHLSNHQFSSAPFQSASKSRRQDLEDFYHFTDARLKERQ